MSGSQTVSNAAPVVSSLRIQTSAHGRPRAIVFGQTRVSVNVIGYYGFRAIEHKSTQNAGGKGGSTAIENTSYTYQVAPLLALCEGPIAGVGKVWVGKSQGALANWNLTLYPGTDTQDPMPYLTTNHPDEALAYRTLAYLGSNLFELGGDATIPNISAEVDSGFGVSVSVRDANPVDILTQYLTNPTWGAGFDAAAIGDLTQWGQFCLAAGLVLSPAYVEQEAAHEAITRLAEITNSGVYYSEGKLKVVPYCDHAITGDLGTFTPSLTPVYDLGFDDFITSGSEEPVRLVGKSDADTFNCIRVKFCNRLTDYNDDIAEAKDMASIEAFGKRPKDYDFRTEINDPAVAQLVAEQLKQRHINVRNTYEFRLSMRHILLEPTDLVTLTDASKGMDHVPARLTRVTITSTGEIECVAEEMPIGSVGATQYPSQATNGYTVNYNAAAGNTNTPVIFEPPLALSGQPELWLALSGTSNWGGADVWISDDDASYRRIKRVYGSNRHGVLTAALPAGGAIDTSNPLKIDVSVSRAQLMPATEAQANELLTLCYVDGELLAYRDADLTGVYQYDLEYLVRGAYNTPITSHPSGSRFARLDDTIVRLPYEASRIGKQVYLKFQSFNEFGGGVQDLSGISPVVYTLAGAPSLVGPTGLALVQPFTGAVCQIRWNAVPDAASYVVEVWADSPLALQRTVNVGNVLTYSYSAEDATLDGGPWRSLVFRVSAVDVYGQDGAQSQLSASNPAPAALLGLRVDPEFNALSFKCTRPTDPDFAGVLIWVSTSSGFTPGAGNLVYSGPDVSVWISRLQDGTPLVHGATYYVRAAAFDLFGQDSLNVSSELSATPLGGEIILEALTGSITKNQLYLDLGKQIDSIDDMGAAMLEQIMADNTEREGQRQDVVLLSKAVSVIKQLVGDSWAEATQRLELESRFVDWNNYIYAGLEVEQLTRASADSALSSQITTVQTTVNGHTTSLSQQLASIDGLRAQYVVRIDAGGAVAGYGLASGIGTPSAFFIRADKFAIAAPSGTVGEPTDEDVPFMVVTTPTVIDGITVPPGVYLKTAYISHLTADRISATDLSAITANLGTVTAGKAQNAAGTNYIDFNASGTASFLKVGTAVDIKANGSGIFARSIVDAPNIVADDTETTTIAGGTISGLSPSDSWVGNPSFGIPSSFELIIDTGITVPSNWYTAPSDMYSASVTISGGNSHPNGGCNGFGHAEVVLGDGLINANYAGNYGTPYPVDNRVYIRYRWTWGGQGSAIRPSAFDWKLVRL